MKITLALFTFLLVPWTFAQNEPENGYRVSEEKMIRKSEPQIQKEEADLKSDLQQAKEYVRIDEKNIQKAEAKKMDDEGEVEIDKASIKKHKAQLQEDEARVEKIEKALKSIKKK